MKKDHLKIIKSKGTEQSKARELNLEVGVQVEDKIIFTGYYGTKPSGNQ
jgi:hypothetical protein